MRSSLEASESLKSPLPPLLSPSLSSWTRRMVFLQAVCRWKMAFKTLTQGCVSKMIRMPITNRFLSFEGIPPVPGKNSPRFSCLPAYEFFGVVCLNHHNRLCSHFERHCRATRHRKRFRPRCPTSLLWVYHSYRWYRPIDMRWTRTFSHCQ